MIFFNLSDSEKAGKKYVLVVGCGRLGANIASTLYEEGNDVCVIDKDKDAFRKLAPSFGGLTETGDAADMEVLARVRADQADCCILATDNDNMNIMVSQLVDSFFHTQMIVCRLFDPDKECIYEGGKIKTICPAALSAKEIGRLINRKEEAS